MKPQTTGLLLCALLLSTFGHEFSHRLKTSQARKSHFVSRDADANRDGLCCVPCSSTEEPTTTPSSDDNDSTSGSPGENTTSTEPTDPTSRTTEPDSDGSPTTDSSNGDGNSPGSPGGSGVKLLVNATSNLVGLVSVTAKIAFVIDIKHNFVAAFNGSSGAVIIVNLHSKVAFYISGNSTDGSTWGGSGSFESYFRRLVSLQALFKYASKHGERITTTNIRAEVLILIQATLVLLGEQNVSANSAVALFIQYSLRIRAVFNGSLKGILTVFGSVVVLVSDGRTVISVFQGLARIFSQIKGGIKALIRANIRLDLSKILNARSSIEIFIYIYTQISSHVDLKPLIRAYSQNVFALLALFSGNSTVGISGIITVLAQVSDLAQGRIDIDVLITVLIQYFSTNSGENTSIVQEFRQSLQLLLDFFQKSGLSQEFSALIVVIKAILNNDYKINGIDFIVIITILTEANSARLHLLVRLLVVLEAVVKIEISVGLLLYRLILLIIDGQILILRALVPEIEIDASVNILAYIFGGIKLSDLRQNLYKVLIHLRIIGPIIVAIDDGLGTCSHTTIQIIFTRPAFLTYARLIISAIIKVLPRISGEAHVETPTTEESDRQLSANQRHHVHENVKHQHQHQAENKHNEHLHNSVRGNEKHQGVHHEGLHEKHHEEYSDRHHERENHHEKKLHHDRKHNEHTRHHEKRSHNA